MRIPPPPPKKSGKTSTKSQRRTSVSIYEPHFPPHCLSGTPYGFQKVRITDALYVFYSCREYLVNHYLKALSSPVLFRTWCRGPPTFYHPRCIFAAIGEVPQSALLDVAKAWVPAPKRVPGLRGILQRFLLDQKHVRVMDRLA